MPEWGGMVCTDCTAEKWLFKSSNFQGSEKWGEHKTVARRGKKAASVRILWENQICEVKRSFQKKKGEGGLKRVCFSDGEC